VSLGEASLPLLAVGPPPSRPENFIRVDVVVPSDGIPDLPLRVK
jgi:hypothetical protein